MKKVEITNKNDAIEGENELILELSIGGIFNSARESQAYRRRKREEKLKNSVGFGSCGSVTVPFVENKVLLESEIVRQNNDVLENERVWKKEKIGNGNLPENKDEIVACGRRNCMVNSYGSGGGGSSAYSDGGATDDSRSNSSNYQLDQQPATTSTASDPFDRSDPPTGSSKQTISTTKLTDSSASEPSLVKPNEKLNPHESSVSNPPSMIDTSSPQQQASFLARMPCVSTTGNGPNGKTVSGFLYRYTRNEVSIVCICHGQSFSPAGFVEHAGGVDITHPLKRITIFPTAFAS